MAPVEVRGLSKRFGQVLAVNNLSFDIEAGRVTGFLGPNGAGKSTTLRALLGLIHPTGGSALFDGKRYEDLDHPSAEVGAVLEDASFHPGRSARNHLRVLAVTGRHAPERVDQVLHDVGLTQAADRRVKGYSMGMRQRLAIAAALLGDPDVLILDEPTNGLDPPGIAWMRGMLREQASRGRAVLISSHLLAEVAQSVDDVIVISRGELRAQGRLATLLGGTSGPATEVVAEDPAALTRALEAEGHGVVSEGDSLIVPGLHPAQVGRIAGAAHVTLLLLTPRERSLENAFLELTGEETPE
jgi:ABC-2 type transport system ATP-binding protein